MKYIRQLARFDAKSLKDLRITMKEYVKSSMIDQLISELNSSEIFDPVQKQTHPDFPVVEFELSFWIQSNKDFKDMMDLLRLIKLNAKDDSVLLNRIDRILKIINNE